MAKSIRKFVDPILVGLILWVTNALVGLLLLPIFGIASLTFQTVLGSPILFIVLLLIAFINGLIAILIVRRIAKGKKYFISL